MKNIVITNKIHFYATLLLVLFPLLPIIGRSFVVIIWAIVTVYVSIKNIVYPTRQNLWLLLLFPGLYIIYIITLIYSESTQSASNYLVRILPLLIFPILFYFLPVKYDKKSTRFFCLMFSIAVIAFTTGVIIFLVFSGFLNDLRTGKAIHHLIRERVGYYTWLNSAYLSLFLGFSFLFILLELLNSRGKIKIWYFIAIIAALFYTFIIILLLSSKMTILSLLIISTFILFFKLKNKTKSLLISSAIIILIVILTLLIPTSRQRFHSLKNSFTTEKDQNKNTDRLRALMIKSSFTVIKEHFLLGVGIGDYNNELIKQYKKDKLSKAVLHKLNTHNQYLEIWLIGGIIALLVFIASLFYPLYYAVKLKNETYMIFLLLMIFGLLTENILNRQAGIIFFSFFNSLFGFNMFNSEEQ